MPAIKRSTDKPPSLTVEPLAPEPNYKPRGPGRRPKPELPAPPDFKMDPFEKQWYDYHIAAFLHEYPDLTPTDHIHLMLASCEFVKWLRMLGTEFASKELVSQARQHPGTAYMRLMDSLSVNRKARKAEAKSKPSDDDTPDWIKALSSN